jgi:hypothetical protein
LELVGVDSFLVNVAAFLVVVNQGDRGCERNLPAVLNAGQLTDGFSDASFVEDAECFPENEDRVLAFAKLLQVVMAILPCRSRHGRSPIVFLL